MQRSSFSESDNGMKWMEKEMKKMDKNIYETQ